MTNIFDRMSDEGHNEFERDSAPANLGTFTVQFGTENATVGFREGMTVKDAFIMNAEFLGFDIDRHLAFRDDHNNLLDGNEAPEVGRVYTASITHDEKG